MTTKPGVYVMRDKDGIVIYVGKAKNLRQTHRIVGSQADTNSLGSLNVQGKIQYSESRHDTLYVE